MINTDVPALFNVHLPIPVEYKPLLLDISRILAIQVMIHVLLCMTNPEVHKLFSSQFFKTLLFILIGVMVYWLIFKKLVLFTYKDE